MLNTPRTDGPDPSATAQPTEQPWQACIRPLAPSQLYHYQWHLLRLEDRSRRSRFGAPASDAFLRQYGAAIDSSDTLVLGCFVDGHMRGGVELRSLRAGWRKQAEIAFSVEERWQGQGIGKALMAAAVQTARAQNFARLYLTCHALNRPMQSIAEGAGARIGFESCECFAEIDVVAQPTPLALAS
jgi:RimJ/RimL family protein N-acetyltransferase